MYHKKYLKYKQKYSLLKKQLGDDEPYIINGPVSGHFFNVKINDDDCRDVLILGDMHCSTGENHGDDTMKEYVEYIKTIISDIHIIEPKEFNKIIKRRDALPVEYLKNLIKEIIEHSNLIFTKEHFMNNGYLDKLQNDISTIDTVPEEIKNKHSIWVHKRD